MRDLRHDRALEEVQGDDGFFDFEPFTEGLDFLAPAAHREILLGARSGLVQEQDWIASFLAKYLADKLDAIVGSELHFHLHESAAVG